MGEVDESVAGAFHLIAAIIVFSMQVGFSLLEAGTVRNKNTRSIMVKNVLDTCVCAIAFWMFGYAIAFGSGSSIIGWNYSSSTAHGNTSALFPAREPDDFFFQFTFVATSSTIIAGAVAERTQLVAYLLYNFAHSSIIYPVIAHTIWAHDGLFSARGTRSILGTNGVLDTAGSMVVHMTGGMSSLVGAYLVGPRIGRFDIDGKPIRFKQHSMVFSAGGTLILWFGFYGFNGGSYSNNGELDSHWVESVGKVCLVTTLCPAVAGVTVFSILMFLKQPRADDIFNGVIGGLVSACAVCSVVEAYAAIPIGIGAGVAYLVGRWLMLKLQIDDVVMATPTHLFCGTWGAIAAGLFATKQGVSRSYRIPDPVAWGLFYGGGWNQLGAQIVGVLLVWAWVGVTTYVLFFLMAFFGVLRVARHEEELGLDISILGELEEEGAQRRMPVELDGSQEDERGRTNRLKSENRRMRKHTRSSSLMSRLAQARHSLNIASSPFLGRTSLFPWAMQLKQRGKNWRELAWGNGVRSTAFGKLSIGMYEANYVMEDTGEVEVSDSGVYLAVHDGHGGTECALYLRENLYKNLIDCFLLDRGTVSLQGIERAFEKTDEDFMTAVRANFVTAPHLATVGACSAVAVVTGSMLYVANVGDSRAVLGRKASSDSYIAVQLSQDHNVNIEEERIKYQQEHPDDLEVVSEKQGRWRVKGKVQVTRAFGDCFMKAADLNTAPLFPRFRVQEPFFPPLLSARPYTSVHALEDDDAFLILASDGLWDLVSNQEAVDLVAGCEKRDAVKVLIKEAVQRAAGKHEIPYEELVSMSSGARREYHDDITVIVFFFGRNARVRKRDRSNLFWEQSLSLKGGQEVQLALKTQAEIKAKLEEHEERKRSESRHGRKTEDGEKANGDIHDDTTFV